MPYLVVENFKLGLDARKYGLAAPAGSLVTLTDGHITSGGEIEGRKSWAALGLKASLSDSDNNDPASFGIQALSDRFVVFGSAVPYTGSVTLGQPQIVDELPTSPVFEYQQLQHPAVTDGATYDGTKHRMTAVICSDQFGDKAFAVARFADGNVFAYYDGTIIPAFRNGLVVAGRTAAENIAAQIAAALEGALPAEFGYVVEASTNHVDVKAPPNATFTLTVGSESDTGGLLHLEDPETGAAASAGVGAVCAFDISGGVDGATFSSLTVPDGLGATVELLAESVDWATDDATTVVLLAEAINGNPTDPPYKATASGGRLILQGPADLGDGINDLNATLTFDGTVTVNGASNPTLTARVSPTGVSGSAETGVSSVRVQSNFATCYPSGGPNLAPTFEWSEWSTGSGNGIEIADSDGQATNFAKTLSPSSGNPVTVVGTFKCTVTQGGSTAVSNMLTVTLSASRVESESGGGINPN